jgi:hypothetical protein
MDVWVEMQGYVWIFAVAVEGPGLLASHVGGRWLLHDLGAGGLRW